MSDDKLSKWAKFLNSISKLISKLIWLAVILIIAAGLGKYFIFKKDNLSEKTTSPKQHKIKPTASINWTEIDQKIIEGIKKANYKAKLYAQKELEAYAYKLKERIDKNFLNWYFSYWTQQILGIKGLYHEVFHYIDENHPGAAVKITEEVQKEFAKRVLKPAISQMELERITRETVNRYISNLQKELAKIPDTYQIAKEDWEKHLEGIAITTMEVEGGRSISLSLKTIALGSAAGVYVLGKALLPFFKKIGSKVSVKLAGKAASKLAAKTGSKVAAETGGEMLGPIIGIGIIIWDIYDHYRTRSINEPILRENLYDYVDLMTEELLNSPDSGVMSVIYKIEEEIIKSI